MSSTAPPVDDVLDTVDSLRAQLVRMTALRQEERIGRTRAEKTLREMRHSIATVASPAALAAIADSAGSLAPAQGALLPPATDGTRAVFIGRVRSVYRERNGTPNQPQRCPASRATIVFDRRVSLATSGGFDGIEHFSHVWVTFLFHGNTGRTFLKGKVTPPRHTTAEKIGIWACRTPHRVNELGLSLCEVSAVDHARGLMHLRGVDLIDNTPVVDVKPYIPAYDSVPSARVPQWVLSSVDRPADFSRVDFAPAAHEVLLCICAGARPPAPTDARTLGYEGLYRGEPAAFQACVEQTLQWDIRSHFQRSQGIDTFSVLLDGVRFRFRIYQTLRAIVVETCTLEHTRSFGIMVAHDCEAGGVAEREDARSAVPPTCPGEA